MKIGCGVDNQSKRGGRVTSLVYKAWAARGGETRRGNLCRAYSLVLPTRKLTQLQRRPSFRVLPLSTRVAKYPSTPAAPVAPYPNPLIAIITA